MNFAVEALERFAAVPDHRARKSRHRLRGNFDRTGGKKFVVLRHEGNVELRATVRKGYGVTSASLNEGPRRAVQGVGWPFRLAMKLSIFPRSGENSQTGSVLAGFPVMSAA